LPNNFSVEYNWKEIFKNTSSQELYQIYKGQTPKTGEAILYAKRELERRHFDFDNMEQNRKNWELLNTLENETIDRFDFSGQKTTYISFWKYILILSGTLIFFYLLNWYEKNTIEDYIKLIPFAIMFSGLLVIMNNLIYRHQVKKRNVRREKIMKLNSSVEQQNEPLNKSVFQTDLKVKNNEIRTVMKSQITIGIILTIVFVLVAIYRIFLR